MKNLIFWKYLSRRI